MITPLDIKKQEFNIKFRGYDPQEVRALLDQVAKEMESLVKQNAQNSEKIAVMEERLNHYRLMEKSMQDAVLTLQNMMEEKRRVAEQEAEVLIQQGRTQAQNEIQQTRNQLLEMREEIYRLESQKQQFFVRFRTLLKGQLEFLEASAAAELQQAQKIREQSQEEQVKLVQQNRPATLPHGNRFVRKEERE